MLCLNFILDHQGRVQELCLGWGVGGGGAWIFSKALDFGAALSPSVGQRPGGIPGAKPTEAPEFW